MVLEQVMTYKMKSLWFVVKEKGRDKMIHIKKETARFIKNLLRCQSCLADSNLYDIKIHYPESACYQTITLCDDCIQQLIDSYQRKKK